MEWGPCFHGVPMSNLGTQSLVSFFRKNWVKRVGRRLQSSSLAPARNRWLRCRRGSHGQPRIVSEKPPHPTVLPDAIAALPAAVAAAWITPPPLQPRLHSVPSKPMGKGFGSSWQLRLTKCDSCTVNTLMQLVGPLVTDP
uniref:Uncharacterized protein n=1 Tax=Oryza sativa subsp. japonica TaxID=39947 RepID=Q84NW4_ORYSJ|nr:hypothetical protein [Oryza sativa Japonica Group]BAD31180.1 hypothetical protein [Oryza sativa Japonica Group]